MLAKEMGRRLTGGSDDTSFRKFAMPPPCIKLNVERGILEVGSEHDEGHFAAGCAKVVCAAKNAETPHDSGLRKWGRASKSDLSIGEYRCYDTLYERVWTWWCDERANPRTCAHLLCLIVLVEERYTGDALVTDLGIVGIADQG